MTYRDTLNAGVSRAMFHTPTTGNFMNRGPMISYDADDGTGGGGGDEAAKAAAEAAKAAAEKAAADAAKAAADAAKTGGDKSPTDEEAKLLKEVMKNKRAAEAAQKLLDEANVKLKGYDGIDLDKVKAMIADQEKAELAAAEKRGEYDRILKQQREDFEKKTAESSKTISDKDKALASAQHQINELVIGSSFHSSKFLSENTVLSGDKARRLYGDHFEIEGGQCVAYDKPRGETERTPLVDATGSRLSFEVAIEKIVKADADFERIAKSKLRPGAGSQPGHTDNLTQGDGKSRKLSGIDLIKANLDRQRKQGK